MHRGDHQSFKNLKPSRYPKQRIVRSLPHWPFGLMVVMSFLVRYLSVALHEAGHWAILMFYGRGPVMGFSGLIQRWGTPPPQLDGWVRITYYGDEGWLRLASLPDNRMQWVLFLAAGLMMTIILAWAGCFVFYRSSSPTLRAAGLILALVNGLGIILFPLNYFLSSGDTAFIAYYLQVSETLVAVPYEILRGESLLIALIGVATWREKIRWTGSALLGYSLTILV
ncbi:MAG: hypothetical protein D6748_09955, partial [Calditrichaeota bacterium]